MRPNRLEAFSDGVIAIIITIMVLELKTPTDPAPAALLKMWPVFLSYVLSFILVAIYWINHHHLVHLMKTVDGTILWINANLLFWMSLIPWTTEYLGLHRANQFSIGIYAGLQLACCFSFYFFRAAVFRQHSADPRMVEMSLQFARKNLLAAVIYAGSILAAAWSSKAALALIVLPAIMYFLPDRRIEHATVKPHADDVTGSA